MKMSKRYAESAKLIEKGKIRTIISGKSKIMVDSPIKFRHFCAIIAVHHLHPFPS